MRHTCAVWLVSAGTVDGGQRSIGHSTIKMTERYAHLAPDQVCVALGLLEAAKSHSSHTESDALAGEGACPS